jgi:hypothetical protein
MYIVGSPRSGSTAYAIHKSIEQNVPFRGELTQIYVLQPPTNRINYKRMFHETGVQPDYTLSEYMMHWENILSPASLYLINSVTSTPRDWGDAIAYITRKNFRNILKSGANYLIKNNPFSAERDCHFLQQQMTFAAIGTCTLLKYCNDHQKEITWYEDVFDRDTEYTFYDGYTLHSDLENHIEGLIQELRPELLNQNIVV